MSTLGYVSHANRGAALEQLVEQANAAYLARGTATVQKVPTPTKALRDGHGGVKVVRERSTVDFLGTWGGRPVAFDAKMCREGSFPLKNLHDHQVGFLQDWERAGGYAFLLIWHEPTDARSLLPLALLMPWWLQWKGGGRASIPAEDLRRLPRVRPGRGCSADYLAALEGWLAAELGGNS